MLITSAQNPRVKQMVALRERRERERTGLIRVEGYEELQVALDSGAQPTELFYCPSLFGSAEGQKLLGRIDEIGTELIEVSVPVFEKMAYREGPDGWLATFPAIAGRLEQLHLGTPPFVVVAQAIEKPGNLGAILRTADAASIHAMIAADPITDWGNPNIIRASKGTVFTVPVASATSAATLAWLHERGIQIVAATPQATINYTDVNLRRPIALAVGAEKHGLSPTWLEAADVQVRIPMFGVVNSLNVATAMALLIYEAVRQRQTREMD